MYRKFYTTENAFRSHLSSRKHKENELKAVSRQKKQPTAQDSVASNGPQADEPVDTSSPAGSSKDVDMTSLEPAQLATLTVDADASDDEVNQTIDEKIAAARARISPTQCLFCTQTSSSLQDNLTHMSAVHSFFIPDAEYLVDLSGLTTYLGEKIAVGNVCIYCNGKGREFRTLDAVRKHMLDKGHCKIAYDTEGDRLEISDFYDFSSSYPTNDKPRRKNAKRAIREGDASGPGAEAEEWEDVDEEGDIEVDEVVDESESESDSSDGVPDNELAYGDTEYELVLPSGARIGHRSMRRYYAQSFTRAPRGGKPEDPNSGAALVRRLLDDKHSALVPRKGGFGAYGSGTEVIKARNRGEAREAGRHVREFRDQRRREDFKTKVGFIHNNQKHFRDPLLQVNTGQALCSLTWTLTPFVSDSNVARHNTSCNQTYE
ncbi:hypothetical protein FOMPIDRAFT_1050208 [Fomitopsis schrenkii]|uniref:ZN622/Rei1/Reh1 zinc finger C2H2-type domain-containing protein n=1 Tax=Fomitopsis schrenkii TaxID=2126942 RepID=S8E573_FOMSC|nr:hypothetical protein FOMPIDRAFT_1050208 [Fomitopsis schrenkii]